jgi:hypothetical protein
MKASHLIKYLRLGAIVLAGLSLLVVTAHAYPDFGGCKTCHSNFRSGSPSMHDLHVDVLGCFDCHKSIGDTPETNSSGSNANYSCNGCHPKAGLATHHVNAGQTVCNDCHASVIGTYPGENFLAYNYQDGRTDLLNPCRLNPANGGEDLNGDGHGLDNDGDGLYDANDPDCDKIIPVEQEAWGTVKAIFGR